MKYTLDESIKHVLEERYILTEDATTLETDLNVLHGILLNYANRFKDDPNAKDTDNIQTIKQELSALDTTLSAFNKTSLNFIDKAVNKLSGQALKSSDAAKIKGTTKEVIQKVETLLANSSIANEEAAKDQSGTAISVKDYLHQIKMLAVSDDVSKETLLKIKENVAKIAAVVSNLSSSKSKDSSALKSTIKAIQNAFMSINDLKAFIKQLGGVDKFTALNGADEIMTTITALIDEHKAKKSLAEMDPAIKKFSTLVSHIIETSGINLDVNRTETIDWDSRFEKASDKRSFWNSYYEKAWGSNGNKIRALGDPFRNQCEQLGFSEKTNPFITFVKKYVIEKNYPIGVAAYTAIHNAVANGKIGQDLLNGTAGNKLNILICKDLYTKQTNELTEYLNLYYLVNNKAELDPNTLFSVDIDNIDDATRKKNFEAVISHLDRNDKSRNQITWLLLFETMPFTNGGLLAKNETAKISAYNEAALEDAKLRKQTELWAIIKILNPSVTNISSKAFTNNTLQALIAKMPKASAANKTQIGQWILVMIGQFLAPEAEEQLLQTYPKLASIALSPTDRAKIKKQILDFGNSMSRDQIIAILTAYENGIDGDDNSKVSFK